MNENKHTPDIKCYRINYNSKYWANVAAKVGNQCSSPVGAVFAVNALCDAYEDIAKQRDELLAALERFATWARCQHRAQSKGCHATFDMMMLRDEIDFAEAAIASVKETK